MRRVWLWLAMLTACGATGGAQDAPGDRFDETVEVRLVLVDALVTDRDGRPVLDLEAEEFQLFADGEPVEISQFSAPGASPRDQGTSRAARPAAAAAPAARPERIVIFLDELHLGQGSRLRILDQLVEVVGKLPREVEVMLAIFDGVVRVDLPFSRDRKRLRAALEGKARAEASTLLAGFEEERLLQMLPFVGQTAAELMLGRVPRDQILEQVCRGDLGMLVRTHAAQTRSRVEATADALREFVASLSAYEGRKTLLHVSDGIPLVAGQGAFDLVIEMCDGSLGSQMTLQSAPLFAELPPARYFPTEARLEMQEYSTAAAWSRLAAEANTYRVTLNTLQASGLTAPRASAVDGVQMTLATETAERFNDQDTLYTMADATGGRAMFNTNDFRPDLERVIEDDELRYELAFSPARPLPGRTYELKVKVARPGLRVRHRKSYRSKSPDEAAADVLMATLFHGHLDNRHDLRLTAEPTGTFEGRHGEVMVRLEIPMDRLTLLPAGDNLLGQATVYVAARDESGGRTGVGRKDLLLRVRPEDAGEAYVYEIAMSLPHGHEYEIGASLRDELGGGESQVLAAVEVARPR